MDIELEAHEEVYILEVDYFQNKNKNIDLSPLCPDNIKLLILIRIAMLKRKNKNTKR